VKTCFALLVFMGTLISARAADVHIFAAVSLTDAMHAIAAKYEPASGDKIVFNFAGSNVLALQITHGAPADLFFSADEAQMDRLAKAGSLDPASRKDILFNKLVVVVGKDSPFHLNAPADLASPDIKHLALADPRSVPAGVYAKAYLEKEGLWAKIESRVIPTENVRAALAAVESGNVDAGVVYQTDAKISTKVQTAFVFPDTAGISIAYPAALLHDAAQPAAAKKFLAYLEGPEAAAIFSSYGFIVAAAPHDK
jgi:molybdate transport system substrate-binding protein